jgi:hypothetical protein
MALKARCASALLAFLLVGCASSRGSLNSDVPPSASSDNNYADVLEKWARSGSVHHLFQKKMDVQAIMLTNEFRAAYLERMTRLRGDTQSSLDESVGRRVGFLVSLSTPERAYENLDDKRLWTAALQLGTLQVQNAEIRPLSDKTLLDPFFPFVTQWSREFLVMFDPGATGELPQSVILKLKSALVALDLEWRQ